MENTFRIGRFEELVLRAVWRLGANAYGVTIRREIADRTGREYSVGALYTALDRLEQKGFVTSRLGDPTPERGGRAKKYFRIEADGIRALNLSQDVVAAMGGLIHVR
jgi:DNA-binding PadR family transcriptional regulator